MGNGNAEPTGMEWHANVPRSIWKQTAGGLALLAATFGGFGTWAATAPLASAVIAQGKFVASGQNKVVQHLEGGVIKDLLVSEGDRVVAGQPLLHLDETAALAKERQLFLRQARLEAIAARLKAEQTGMARIDFPSIVLSNLSDPEIAPLIESQQVVFQASQVKLKSEVSLLQQNIEGLRFRARGYSDQLRSVKLQSQFLAEEYKGKKELLDRGLIRVPEVKALQRAMADAEGQAGRLEAEVSETGAQIAKFEQQISQTEQTYRQTALEELQQLEAELDLVRQQLHEAKSILKRVIVQAPVSGTIVRMYYHTDGGVIESGKSIMEILPSEVPLMIEAQIPRTDIDDVKIGQHATVRLVGLNQRTTPVLQGEVFYVSADVLTEAALGPMPAKEVYLARVSLEPAELARVPGFAPTPGMPAEVLVQTSERTFFSYLAKPITDTMARSFSER